MQAHCGGLGLKKKIDSREMAYSVLTVTSASSQG